MQKKLLIAFSLLFACANSSAYIPGFETDGIRKMLGIAGLGTLVFIGNSAQEINKKNAEAGTRPDTKSYAFKIAGALAMLLTFDTVMGDYRNTAEHAVRIGAAGVAALAGTDLVGKLTSYIPAVGAVITGPIIEKSAKNDGDVKNVIYKEKGWVEKALRVLLVGGAVRKAALHFFGI